jgi:hypothetical protein
MRILCNATSGRVMPENQVGWAMQVLDGILQDPGYYCKTLEASGHCERGEK